MYLISGRNRGTVAVPDGVSTVGRGDECEIQLSGDNVSRQHCMISWRRRRLTISDVGSANGVWVNGRRVDTCELKSGDRLKIADLSFLVSDKPGSKGPSSQTDQKASPVLGDTPAFDMSDLTARVWYFRRNMNTGGPATFSTLQHWAASGKFTRDDQIRQDPDTQWWPADSVEGLCPPAPEEPAAEEPSPAVARTEETPAGAPDPASAAPVADAGPVNPLPHQDTFAAPPAPVAIEEPAAEHPTAVAQPAEPSAVGQATPASFGMPEPAAPASSVPGVTVGAYQPAGSAAPPLRQPPRRPVKSKRASTALSGISFREIAERLPSGKVLGLLTAPLLVFAVQYYLQSGPPEGQPDLGFVGGTVTLDGDPLAEVSVTFEPDEGRPSNATTDENGYYELQYTARSQGARLGRHTVRIAEPPPMPDPTQPVQEPPAGARERPATAATTQQSGGIPQTYNLNSSLTATVKTGSNTFDFELKSQ